MLTLLAFGTIWFWVVAVAVFLAIVALVENEKDFVAGILLIATIAAFHFFGNSGMLAWIKTNPQQLLWYALGYVGIACGWGILKWTLFVHGENDKYEEAKARFLKDNDATELTPELKKKWTEYAEAGEYGERGYSWPVTKFAYPAPEARDHKSKIVGWMTYWPWSAFWTILNDPVRKLMRFLYNRIAGLLNGISRHAYRNVSDDIVVAVKRKPSERYIDSH